jgi:hypothetical protein
MHIEDAANFIVDYIRRPRPSDGYSTYGYEIYLANIIATYLKEVERTSQHHSYIQDNPRARQLWPFFSEAAWDLCRRGILRPGPKELNGQTTGDGHGYSITTFGRKWVDDSTRSLIVIEPTRLGELFATFTNRLGTGFLQRANEAAQCHATGCYLACCAMCGAAAESVLLAVATAKSGDEDTTLKLYRGTHGRKKTIDAVVGQSRAAIAGPFGSATGLLSFWRDEAAHGAASEISEIEAHEAISRLLRFAQFVVENWAELIA